LTAAFLPFLPALAGALLLTCAYDVRASLGARLAAAVPLAIAALGVAGYALGASFGLRASTLLLAASLLLVLGALVAGRAGRARLRQDVIAARAAVSAALRGPKRPLVAGGLYVLLLGTLLAAVFDRAVVETPRGLGTGVDHNLGDLPFHLSIVAGFVRGANFPPEHPELAGVRLTYPFGVDLAAALHVAAGATFRQAFLFQDLLLAASCAFLSWRLALRLTGDGRAALLTPPLVFLSGGLGFAWFAGDLRAFPGSPWELMARLPRDYTMLEAAGLRWGNALTTLLVPQRAFLLGLPLFLMVATLWWDALRESDPAASRRTMAGAGALAGLLPLAHAHGFVVLLSVGALLALWQPPRKPWLAFYAAALLVGLPQAAWMAHGSSTRAGGFVAWHLGWDRGDANPLVFWALNAGVFLALYLAALARPRVLPPGLARFALPFALWFVVPNLLRLSPWIWDNMKFLFYWYVASAPLAALVLARLSRRGPLGAAAAALLLAAATASGALDAWRVASRSREHVLFDPEALAFAERLVEATPPRALILHHPTYNSPVLLSGRRSLLGYPGHIWSQGLDASDRAADLERVYAGDADATSRLVLLGATHLLVGPQERAGPTIREGGLAGWPLLLTVGPYDLRCVSPSCGSPR
jgi:hypothetical protein